MNNNSIIFKLDPKYFAVCTAAAIEQDDMFYYIASELHPTIDDAVHREEPQHLRPWLSARQVVVG